MVVARRKRQPVESGPSAEDMHWGRLWVLLSSDDGTVDSHALYKSHDHAKPFPDAALEAEAREFAERHRHIWADW